MMKEIKEAVQVYQRGTGHFDVTVILDGAVVWSEQCFPSYEAAMLAADRQIQYAGRYFPACKTDGSHR